MHTISSTDTQLTRRSGSQITHCLRSRRRDLKGLDSAAKTVKDYKTQPSERAWEVLHRALVSLCQEYVDIVIPAVGTLLKVTITRRILSN